MPHVARRGLDDYHFYPFLIGAAQLCGHDSLRPNSIADSRLLEEHYEDCALSGFSTTCYWNELLWPIELCASLAKYVSANNDQICISKESVLSVR